MRSSSLFMAMAALAVRTVVGQAAYTDIYTDPKTNISFGMSYFAAGTGYGGVPETPAWGFAFPESATTTDATDYIGIVVGPIHKGSGWLGLSHGAVMVNSLLLLTWAYAGQIYTSFRYAASTSAAPVLYDGSAKLIPISETITADNYTLIYKCVNCLVANATEGIQNDYILTSGGFLVLSWAQSLDLPQPPNSADGAVIQHNNGFGTYGQDVTNCTFASYSQWATSTMTSTMTSMPAATATASSPANASASPTSATTATTAKITGTPVPKGLTFDYVVVGGGAGGVPFADKVSAAGKKTLLIEKGPPSSGRYGGTMKPDWLVGTNLTRFDVPGLCNEIWVDRVGIACTDIDVMAGCVLGGGTAINAGLWWNPNPVDWDYNFPTGWKSSDMVQATTRAFKRIPGTETPSMDGKLYLQQGFDVLSSGLKSAGWTDVVANDVPAQKNRTYSHTPYMFINGERGGPLATYLLSSTSRPNFKLWTNTTVRRVVRSGGHITGVEVEATGNGGYYGIVNVTTTSGRVVLSAGTFGTPKILMRSGIGPSDQLAIVNASVTDGPTMIDSKSWINLPVGMNLDDHLNTDTSITHPNVTFYDFYGAWSAPIPADKDSYLSRRTGILAQAAPNIGPMFWEEITGADGVVRQLQWTARVEGSGDSLGMPTAMTMSQYLGRGSKSRGRATIGQDLTMSVSTVPYLQDPHDLAAVIQGIENLQQAMSTVKNLTWVDPAPGQSAAAYVASLPVTIARTANHWIGTAKMGLDDGRMGSSATAVVDTNCRVYGTDNLFVIDASIFPGMMSTNPSALIVVAAEHASDKILALAPPSPQGRYKACGGAQFSGSSVCQAPHTCQYVSTWFSQCI